MSSLLSSDFQDTLLSLPLPLSLSEGCVDAGQPPYGEDWPSSTHPFPFDAYGMVMPSAASSDSASCDDPLKLISQKLSELKNQM